MAAVGGRKMARAGATLAMTGLVLSVANVFRSLREPRPSDP